MAIKSKFNSNTSGQVNYSHNVVFSIISLAIQEINGVASLHRKGFRAETVGGYLNVDVYINVKNGVSCADVAFRVQDNIKRSVETMSVYKINKVNVHIMDVEFLDKAANTL